MGLENWARGILALIFFGLAAWTAVENMESYAFRNAGSRCTGDRCSWIEGSITSHGAEDLRLQLQIDTLEDRMEEITRLCLRGATIHDGDLHKDH